MQLRLCLCLLLLDDGICTHTRSVGWEYLTPSLKSHGSHPRRVLKAGMINSCWSLVRWQIILGCVSPAFGNSEEPGKVFFAGTYETKAQTIPDD